MRDLSNNAILALTADSTSEVCLPILAIKHEDLPETLYFVRNLEQVISNGHTYLPCAFDINLPSEKDEAISNAMLTIDNVDRAIVTAIRSISSPPSITLSIILADSPDVLEIGPLEFILRNITYNVQTVSGELVFEDRLFMNIPGDSFDPFLFPGLF